MRAVQQSMTMAMAVNMASSPTGFVTPVGGGPAVSSQNPAHQQPLSFLPITSPNVSQDEANQTQYVPAGQSSKYPASQPSNIGTGNTINNIRHSRKRRANSNATER